MQKQWVKRNNEFYPSETSQLIKELPVGIYKVMFDQRTLQFYVSQTIDKFVFPYKVYGQETNFINRVVKTYHNTTGNLGVLMNGVKGTGKTVTTQQICNNLNLPVLIIHEHQDALPSFLNDLQQDVIIFFDEYEKMYKNYDSDILTVMDGVLNNEYRKVFLLTTNTSFINENMLQRPGRIRYVKTFTDLTVEVITEIVDDKLLNKKFREACITFISKLEIITIDIVKAIIDEVNIHNEEPENFKDVFNIKTLSNKVDVFTRKGLKDPWELKYESVLIAPSRPENLNIYEDLYIDGEYVGEIISIVEEGIVIVDVSKNQHTFNPDGEEDYHLTFKLTHVDSYHKSFTKFTF